jgi:hypothetical protein
MLRSLFDGCRWLVLPLLASACTASGGLAASTSPSIVASPSASHVARSPIAFEGDLVGRVSGTGNRDIGRITLHGDAELYLQCPQGNEGVTVNYDPLGVSACPPDAQPLVARVSASHYPVDVHFRVTSSAAQRWILAVDSHPVERDPPLP